MPKVIRIALKSVGWLIIVILGIFVLLYFIIQIPSVQNYAKDKAVNYVSRKIHSKFSIGHFYLRFFSGVELDRVYLEDRHKDTLLYADKLQIDISLLTLIRKKVEIQNIALRGVAAHINRVSPDSVFNYQFIIDAFASKDTVAKDSGAPLRMSVNLRNISLDNIKVHYLDDHTGNDALVQIGHFQTAVRQFDLDKIAIDIPTIHLENTEIAYRMYTPLIKTSDIDRLQDAAQTQKDTSRSALPLKIGNIFFKNIHFRFIDDPGALRTEVQLGKLDITPGNLDLSSMSFALKDLSLAKTKVFVGMGHSSKKEDKDTSAAVAWHFLVQNAALDSIDFQYDDSTSRPVRQGMDYAHLNFRNVILHGDSIDLRPDAYKGNITKGSFAEKSGLRLRALSSSFAYNAHGAALGHLLLKTDRSVLRDSLRISYASIAAASRHPGDMYLYAHLPKTTIAASDILLVAPMLDTYMRGYRNAVFHLNTTVYGKIKELHVPSLELQGLQHTDIRMKGYLAGLPDPNKLKFNLQIEKFVTTLQDVQSLLPAGTLPATAKYGSGLIQLKGAVRGDLNNATVSALDFKALSNTHINISGHATNIMHLDKAYYAVTVNKFTTSATDIYRLSPKGAIPFDKIRIPKYISAQGYFRGSLAAMTTRLNVRSTNGNALIAANLNRSGVFNANLGLENLNIGYLARMDTIVGKVSLTAKAKGSGLNFKKFNLDRLVSSFEGNVRSAEVYGYDYKDLSLQGTLAGGVSNLTAGMTDPNINFGLQSVIDLRPEYPAIKLAMQLDTLNLHQLHLVSDTMILKGKIHADFANTNPDRLNGHLTARDFLLVKDSLHFHADSLNFFSKAGDTANLLALSIDSILRIQLDGQYKLTQMGYALQNTIQKYYSIPEYKVKKIEPQHWTLTGYLIPNGAVTDFFPQIKGSDSLTFSGNLSTADSVLSFKVHSNNIVYEDQMMRNAGLSLNTENDSLNLLLGASQVKGKTFNLFGTGIRASMANNTIEFGAGTLDTARIPLYGLGGLLTLNKDSSYSFRLKQNGLILNYDRWQIPAENLLSYHPVRGIHADNFALQTATGQSIIMNSASDSTNAPLNIDFHQFRLSTFTHIANRSNLNIEGILNGTVQMRDILTKPIFTSQLTADSLAYGKDTIGNLVLNIDNEKGADIYNANILLSGHQNDVQLSGLYYNDRDSLDMHFLVHQMNLHTLLPFTAGQLDSIGGFVKADAKIYGKSTQPVINGYLQFDSAYFTPNITGATLKLPNEKMTINEDGIHLRRFTVRDEDNNAFRINGDLLTKNFIDYEFALRFRANNFTLVNAAKADKRFFYGKLNVNTDMQLGGTIASPRVNGLLHVNRQTDFSMVMPTSDPEVEDRNGVVVFVDKAHPLDSVRVAQLTDSLTDRSQIKGMDIALTIETDTAAAFTLVLDERSDDNLKIKGDADLVFGIDPSGKMSLTGAYTLNTGTYKMSIPMLPALGSRSFAIQKGSVITWTGDPLSAIADITANYSVKAAPIDLMQQQLSGSDLTKYKQQLPFTVSLILKNDLMNPDISFDIDVSDEISSQWPMVDTKLSQIRTDNNEINKQVLALLLMGRFIGENPLQSAGGTTTVGDLAKQNAGRLLSDQLNKLASNLIQGVDVNFDLNSGTDYSTGQAQSKTDLNVNLTKRMFNDRIDVSVGSNFALEGAYSNQEAANIAGDISIGYRITKDGRYIMRAYRKNQYEGVIEGQVVNTGVSFQITLDYNKFSELFESEAKRAARERSEQMGGRGKNRNRQTRSSDNKNNKGAATETNTGSQPAEK